MRVFYIFAIAMLMTSGSALAQEVNFSDDFEDGNLAGYTLYNLDGLVPDDPDLATMEDSAWTVKLIQAQGWEYGLSAFSVSWYLDDAGPANDWLVTPAIELGVNSTLEWDGLAITSSGDYRDQYQVFVASDSTLDAFSSESPIFDTGEEGELPEPTHHSINLAENGWSGETVYIAFRNLTQPFNPDEPGGPGNGGNELAIDNILVSSVSSTGPENELFSSVSAFPNPAINVATFEVSSQKPGEIQMTVMDITGKVVSSKKVFAHQGDGNRFTIDLSGSAEGLYLVRFTRGTQTHTERLVIQR